MKKEYPDILKLEGEKWQNPDPATGKLGTRVPAEWLQTTEDSLKSLTLEMLEVLKAAGINPNELNNTQVRDAIQKMILSRVINYNDIQGRPVVKDSLGDDRNNPASQRVVNDVNRDVVTAQKTANTANDKANAAQTRADSAYNLANSKWSAQETVGSGKLMREGAGGLLGETDYVNVNQWWDSAKSGFVASDGRDESNDLWRYGVGFRSKAGDKSVTLLFRPDEAGYIYSAPTSVNKKVSLLTSKRLNTASKAQNGWWKCGSTGLTYQWGYIDRLIDRDASFEFAFNISFLENCFSLVTTANQENGNNADAGFLILELTKTKALMRDQTYREGGVSDILGFYWLAIGY